MYVCAKQISIFHEPLNWQDMYIMLNKLHIYASHHVQHVVNIPITLEMLRKSDLRFKSAFTYARSNSISYNS